MAKKIPMGSETRGKVAEKMRIISREEKKKPAAKRRDKDQLYRIAIKHVTGK